MLQAPCPDVLDPSPDVEIGREQVIDAAHADLALIDTTAASVRVFVNKSLAHRANPEARARADMAVPALDEAMDTLRRILNRYDFALRGHMLLGGPLPQYDWMQAFTFPWVTDERIGEYYERDYREST